MTARDTAPFLAAPSLARFSFHLRHGFFGRAGGVSEGRYASLNCGPGSDDAPAHVAENRARACRALGAEPAQLVTLHQQHSATALRIDAAPPAGARPPGDALATSRPGLVLGVLAADCAPLLMCDPHANVIGAAHAGWRGAVAGVAEACVEAMTALGAAPERIVAAIGPCLSQPSFEVGPDLVEAVMAASPWADRLFAPGEGDRRQFDLAGYVAARLTRAGVGSIESLGEDTLAGADRYFSCRASRRAGEPDYGRNLSAIMLVA